MVRMSPVQVAKVEVGSHCQLVGQLPRSGDKFNSDTAYVSVLMSTGVWYRLAVAQGGWQLRLQRGAEPPAFLKMPTDVWRRMWREVDHGSASLSCAATFKKADLVPAKRPDDDSIACGDAMRVSISLKYKVLKLDGAGVLDHSYDGIFVGTVEEISMTAS